MARHIGYSVASVRVYRLQVMCHERGLYICLPSESNGSNLLDETFERLHSEPCRLSLEVS